MTRKAAGCRGAAWIAAVLACSVLAPTPAWGGGASLTNEGGVLTYTGTDSPETVFVFKIGSDYHVSVPGPFTSSGCNPTEYSDEVACPAAGITRMVFDLRGGDDEVGVGSTERPTYPVTVAVTGGAGADRMAFNVQAVQARGGPGLDMIFGGPGRDVLSGGRGLDLLNGWGGADVLRGDDGADAIRGGAGPDRIYGGAGTDALIGGSGADILHSQDSYRDKVQCGAGYDTVDRDRRDALDIHCEKRY